MNLVMFEAGEVTDGTRLVLRGRRAQHLREIVKVAPGDRIRVGEVNGGIGVGVVQQVVGETITVLVERLGERVERPFLRLVMALPRPQTVKKVLQTSAAFGLDEVHFVRSFRVERSYFSSSVLRPEELKRHLLLGLEQGVETRLPRIQISEKFHIPDRESISEIRLLASPGGTKSLAQYWADASFHSDDLIMIAIGPEGGWTERECAAFRDEGFLEITCGPQVLRVETAFAVLLGQIQLIRGSWSNSRLENSIPS